MLDLGDAVESLGGRYITAEDVGTSPEDMAVVAERTAHVTGLPAERGGCGDPSPLTARGVEAAIRASLAWRTGDPDPAGRRVVVIGVGHVGPRPRARGSPAREPRSSPPTSTRASARRPRRPARAGSSPERAAELDCDVLAPCALGGAIHAGNANALRCRDRLRRRPTTCSPTTPWPSELEARGILYAPDFIANAGGLMGVAAERHGSSPEQVSAAVDGIEGVLTGVYERAAAAGSTPLAAAREIAAERLSPVARGRRVARGRMSGMDELWCVRAGEVPYQRGVEVQSRLADARQAGRDPRRAAPARASARLHEGPPRRPVGARRWARTGTGCRASRSASPTAAGGVTYHGPGQLVGYPIVSLKPYGDDVADYVARMERVMVESLGEAGVPAQTIPGLTGVWTEGPPPAADPNPEAARKIGSIGVHVSRGITTHGFAINVTTTCSPSSGSCRAGSRAAR